MEDRKLLRPDQTVVLEKEVWRVKKAAFDTVQGDIGASILKPAISDGSDVEMLQVISGDAGTA